MQSPEGGVGTSRGRVCPAVVPNGSAELWTSHSHSRGRGVSL